MRRALVLAVVVVGLLLAACSGDDSDEAATTTTTTRPPTTTTTAAPAGCTRRDATPPPGADSAVAGDLDGDGRPDRIYADEADGARVFGVQTAAGGITQWSTSSAAPVEPVVYGVADANEDGRIEIFVNSGRIINVLALFDCRLRPYLNVEGRSYGFDVGFSGEGTGVGCIDADGDGRRDLVGLLRQEDDGDTVHWRRTIVRLEGERATNGPSQEGTYRQPRDAEAISLLGGASCGDQAFEPPLVTG